LKYQPAKLTMAVTIIKVLEMKKIS